MASTNIPDEVYNWLVDVFSGLSHCTRFCGTTSGQLDISACIIQGSTIGPASYVVNAADLTTVTAGNLMFKYADDSYIVIPAINVNSRSTELDHVDQWPQNDNLRLSRAKSAEIIFTNCKRKHTEDQPPQITDIRRVTSIKMLWRHCDESPLCRWACPRRYRQVRAVVARPETATPPRHEWRLTEARLQVRRPLQTVVCITGMVRFYQRGR